MHDDNVSYGCFLVILFIMCLFPTGVFVGEGTAIKALETQGYTNVTVVEKNVFFVTFRGGDARDSVRFVCIATNPIGKQVKVYVFSGWLFKASTVRSD